MVVTVFFSLWSRWILILFALPALNHIVFFRLIFRNFIMKFSSNQFLHIIQMWTHEAWSRHFCHRTFLSLIMHAVNFNYNFFHFNHCHIFKIPNFSLKFIFYEKNICLSVLYQYERERNQKHRHWLNWMKMTGKNQWRLKNDFDKHEINKRCRSSCQMPWMIRFSSNDFNQLLFSSIFFPIETMNQPF